MMFYVGSLMQRIELKVFGKYKRCGFSDRSFLFRCRTSFASPPQGDADSGVDRLWQKKKVEAKQI
ncbi:hypothetical protein Bca52824_061109 [Brassica carinata]|uniref:Uncharacterized protein n=1 Tax=Brassica carinata TaxID=52824 RepID=A0A8X7QX86_BRACI|nr:hypothetical protein Bca52824_061109 [Brassica carinata]